MPTDRWAYSVIHENETSVTNITFSRAKAVIGSDGITMRGVRTDTRRATDRRTSRRIAPTSDEAHLHQPYKPAAQTNGMIERSNRTLSTNGPKRRAAYHSEVARTHTLDT
jgi:hypothetical protein